MKNSLKKLVSVLLTVTALMIPAVTLAQNIDDLFRPFNYTNQNTSGSKIGIVSNIAQRTSGDWTQILAGVIQFVLGITGSLAFISFTYGGVLMVSARGNEDQIKKGKDILTWSVIALAIIATSYAIVLGVSQLRF